MRQPVEEKEWTLLFYMSVADLDMKEELSRDLEALQRIGSNRDVNIVVHCREPSKNTPAHRFLVNKGSLDPYEQVPESLANLGDPQTLVTFVKWADHFFPARKTFLIMWGHGYGVAANLVEHGKHGSQFLGRSLIPERLGGLIPTSIFVYDWDGELTIPDLALAFGQLKEERERKLDVLGFDACFMQGVEVAFELRDFVGYTVGSALGTPKNAWRYTELLEAIQKNPDSSPETVASMVLGSLKPTGDCDEQTVLSVLNLADSEELIVAIAQLVESLEGAYDSRETQAALALRRAEWVDGRQLPDLGDVCTRLAADTTDGLVKSNAQRVLTLLKPGGFVVRTALTDARLRARTGVSIFVPSNYAHGEAAANMNLVVNKKIYRSLAFTNRTRWADWVYTLPMVLDELKKEKPGECRWFRSSV